MGFTIGTMFRSCFGKPLNHQKKPCSQKQTTHDGNINQDLIPNQESQIYSTEEGNRPYENSPYPIGVLATLPTPQTPATRIDFSNLNQPYWDIRASQDLSGSNHGIETSRPLHLAPRSINYLRKIFLGAAHSPACGTKFFTQSDPQNPGSETPPSQRSQTLDTEFTQTVLPHEIYVVEDSPPSSRPSSTENTGSEQHGEETESDTDLQFEVDDV
jgi:hypothetical protein